MKKISYITAFFFLLILVAVFSELRQKKGDKCDFDGNRINPIHQVNVTTGDGKEHNFCSICCASYWLDQNPDVLGTIKESKGGSISVVDEITGETIDATLGYWVRSSKISVHENNCDLHVFKDPGDAARHIHDYRGREVKGFLAGQGRVLPWAPNFYTQDVNGLMSDLLRYRGKVVFIRFWNSSNPFTAKDLGYLQKSYNRWKKRGFVVLAINVQQRKGQVEAFTSGLNLPFPILLDPRGQIADMYKVKGYPTGFLVDRSGIIRNQSIGEILPEMMEPLIAPLLQ